MHQGLSPPPLQEMCKALEVDRLSLEKSKEESEREARRQMAEVALLRERLQQLAEEAQAGLFQVGSLFNQGFVDLSWKSSPCRIK